MTAEEFNEKYKEHLEKGHYGCDIHEESIIDYLDALFQDLTRIPTFQYSQIKWEFGMSRFYSNLGHTMEHLIENKLNDLGKQIYGK